MQDAVQQVPGVLAASGLLCTSLNTFFHHMQCQPAHTSFATQAARRCTAACASRSRSTARVSMFRLERAPALAYLRPCFSFHCRSLPHAHTCHT